MTQTSSYVNTYEVYNTTYGYQSITIADGKAFIDEDNNIYSVSVPVVDVYHYPIDGKTLRPYSTVLRGDVNGDNDVTIADVTTLIDYLLSGDVSSINLTNADCNQDNDVSIADVTALIDYLLSGSW